MYDKDNKKILEMFYKLRPEYANHMFRNNKVVEKFLLNKYGGINIKNRPICLKCEKPCMYTTTGAYCDACGTNIPKDKIKTMWQYWNEQLKSDGISMEDIILKTYNQTKREVK